MHYFGGGKQRVSPAFVFTVFFFSFFFRVVNFNVVWVEISRFSSRTRPSRSHRLSLSGMNGRQRKRPPSPSLSPPYPMGMKGGTDRLPSRILACVTCDNIFYAFALVDAYLCTYVQTAPNSSFARRIFYFLKKYLVTVTYQVTPKRHYDQKRKI